MNIVSSLIGLIRYRTKLYYAEVKSGIQGGSFIYNVKDNIKFVCSKDDSFSKVLFISNGHEKLEMEWCKQWLNTVKYKTIVIDCGANIGFFSSYLAQTNSGSEFIAIEGNENTFKHLNSNLSALKLKNVKTIQAILAESKELKYHIPDIPGKEPWQQAKSLSDSKVQTVTLDEIAEVSDIIPDLIKIDCEGFEVKILKGASKILKLSNTAFMVECNDYALKEASTSRAELLDLFRSNDYRLYHLASFDLKLPLGKEIDDHFPSKEFNFVAVPNKAEFLNRWDSTLRVFKDKSSNLSNG